MKQPLWNTHNPVPLFLWTQGVESVNMSQMDIKSKTCDIRNWRGKNIYFSTYPPQRSVHLSHRFTSSSKPTAYTSASGRATSANFVRPWENSLNPIMDRFTRWTLPTVYMKHFFVNILCIKSSCSQKKRVRESCSSVVHISSTGAILTTETSLWTCACAAAT
jgi:hypothetical protein